MPSQQTRIFEAYHDIFYQFQNLGTALFNKDLRLKKFYLNNTSSDSFSKSTATGWVLKSVEILLRAYPWSQLGLCLRPSKNLRCASDFWKLKFSNSCRSLPLIKQVLVCFARLVPTCLIRGPLFFLKSQELMETWLFFIWNTLRARIKFVFK